MCGPDGSQELVLLEVFGCWWCCGVYLRGPELAMQGAIWGEAENMVMQGWIGIELSCRAQALSRRFSAPNFGVQSRPYSLSGLGIWVLTKSQRCQVLRSVAGSW